MLRVAVLASALVLAGVRPATSDAGTGADAEGPLVSVAPGRIDAAQRSLDVDIVIEDGEGVAGFQFVLVFDGRLLELLDIDEGEFLRESGRQSLCPIPRRDGDAVRFACATIGQLPVPTKAAGRLAMARFHIKEEGTSAIALRRLRLVTVLGEEVPSQAADASVKLQIGPSGAGVSGHWWWLAGAAGAALGAAVVLYGAWRVRRARGAAARGPETPSI
jgi:hypothetical protein